MSQGRPLGSSALRALLAPAALAGLGSTAGRSLQQEFDGCVACLGAMASGCSSAADVLAQVLELAQGGGADALEQIRGLLGQRRFRGMFSEGPSEGGASGAGVDVVALLTGGAAAVEGRLAAWQGLAKSHQAPSRVLRWAMD